MMKYKAYMGFLLLLALLAGLALSGANVMLGDLNQDEGWYLYAARMVRTGKMPYVDFAYTQGPVLPFVYSLAEPFVRMHGLMAGRIFTALLGLAGACFAALLAARLAGSRRRFEAGVLALILVLVNVYQSYFYAVVKTYALTSFFLMAGFWALSVALERRSQLAMLFSAALLVFAAGTRTSAGVIPPLVFLCLFLDRESRSFFGWLCFGVGCLLTGCAIIVPWLLIAPENFWFFAAGYHTMRDSGDIAQGLVYKAGFMSRILGAYFVAIGLWLILLLARWFRCSARNAGQPGEVASGVNHWSGRTLDIIIWVCVIAVTLVHIMAPFPYDDYQVFIFPVFAVAVAVMAVRFMRPASAGMAWLMSALFCLSLGAAVSSPINKDWFVRGRDRIWWRLKDQTPLEKLRDTGAMLREMSRPGDLLLTQDPYLAVESGLTLPRGLEMGQFSYFPDFDDETAEKLNVLNYSGMIRLLRECDAPVAALSGYAFAISSPQIKPVSREQQDVFWDEVSRHYEPVLEIPDFGQAFTTLRILKRKLNP